MEGPWTDETVVEEPSVMTRQLHEFIEKYVKQDKMRSWQKQMFKILSEDLDDRTIHHICDTKGHSGKSIFCEYLEYLKICLEVPMLKNMDELNGYVFSFPIRRAYCMDMRPAWIAGMDCRGVAEA